MIPARIVNEQLVNQVIADGLIRREHYHSIPEDQRYTLNTLFSPAGRQAFQKYQCTSESLKQYAEELHLLETHCSINGKPVVGDNAAITVDRYLSERLRLKEQLFSEDAIKALKDGVITLQQYLETPLFDRQLLQILFTADGRAAITEKTITVEGFIAMSNAHKRSMQTFVKPNLRQAVKEGVITLKSYLEVTWNYRDSLDGLFSSAGREAIKSGSIILADYLSLVPPEEVYKLENMQFLLSKGGLKAIEKGLITLRQYVDIEPNQRDGLEPIFSDGGWQAIDLGLITFDYYLQLSYADQRSLKPLFSDNGLKAIRSNLITLERYLEIPEGERIQALEKIIGRYGKITSITKLLAQGSRTPQDYQYPENQNSIGANNPANIQGCLFSNCPTEILAKIASFTVAGDAKFNETIAMDKFDSYAAS